jgi:murein DD-endopeptidase MepM/ murein hydrolase activator NlpD
VDDIVYRPRYQRHLSSQPKRKTRKSKRDKNRFAQKFITKTIRQTLICFAVFLLIMSLTKIKIPQAVFLQNKLKGVMSYNIDLKDTFSDIHYVFNNLAEETENSDEADYSLDGSEGLESNVLDASILTDNGNQERYNEELEPVSALYTEEGSLVESMEYENDDSQTFESEITRQQNGSENEKIFGNAGYSFLIPVGGIIGSFYGERLHPIKNTTLFHKGIDIEAQSGTPIKASYDGEVIEADQEASYGNYVKLKHIDGLTTLYAHCSKLLVSKGQKVSKGDVIAEVGATGAANGPHLHFEVRKDNTTVNPLDYITLSDSE